MNIVDRQAIEDLVTRLKDAEQRGGPRDAEAEALIARLVQRQPAAAYYLAQTVLVQQWALNAAHDEIARHEPRSGGILGALFGGRRRAAETSAKDAMPASLGQNSATGFLATAANTAVGLAGGFILHDLLAQAHFTQGSLADSFSQPPSAPVDAGMGMGGDFGGGDFGGGGE